MVVSAGETAPEFLIPNPILQAAMNAGRVSALESVRESPLIRRTSPAFVEVGWESGSIQTWAAALWQRCTRFESEDWPHHDVERRTDIWDPDRPFGRTPAPIPPTRERVRKGNIGRNRSEEGQLTVTRSRTAPSARPLVFQGSRIRTDVVKQFRSEPDRYGLRTAEHPKGRNTGHADPSIAVELARKCMASGHRDCEA